MWLWLSWINQIFPIEYHGVTVHHRDDTHSQDLCSLCIIHILAKQQGKHGVIHYEFTDLFTQLVLTWKTWGYNAYNDETPWKHYLHMAPWMESFDLSKPLRWGHIGAMASRITGNSTDCLATCSDKQVRRHEMSILEAFYEGNPPETGDSPNKGPVMCIVPYYFDRNYTEIHSWGTSHYSCVIAWRQSACPCWFVSLT